MKKRIATLFALLALFPGPGAMAGDQREPASITWLVPDFPPAYISRGPQAGEGQGDQVLEWFQQALPGYNHHVRREPLARTLGILATGEEDVCVPGFPAFAQLNDTMIRGEPIGVVPPLRLITLRDRVGRFPVDAGRVSLNDTLADPQLTLALMVGRNYLDVDALLARHREQANVLTVSPGDMVGTMFGLLLSGRVDYLVEHGFLIPYVDSLEPERAGELVMLPLEEANQSVIIYPMCRPTVQGRNLVQALNRISTKPAFRRMMIESTRRLLPEPEKAGYEQWLRDQLARSP